MRLISSKDNPQYKFWKQLTQGKGLSELGYFIVSGKKLVQECKNMSHLEIRAEIVTDDLEPGYCVNVFRLPKSLFDGLDVLGTHYNLLIVKVPELETFIPEVAPQGVEVVAPLGDPRNLGALIRSAVGFNASKIILTQESCHPFLPQAVKAASLACLQVPFTQGPALSELQGHYYVLDAEGEPIDKIQFPPNLRLLVGQEGLGTSKLNPKAQLTKISIPMKQIESLNATIAASIALYQISRSLDSEFITGPR